MKKSEIIIPFIISGIGGLVLQVLWSRYFYIIFGSTIYSVSIIISIFMLGISLGSLFNNLNILIKNIEMISDENVHINSGNLNNFKLLLTDKNFLFWYVPRNYFLYLFTNSSHINYDELEKFDIIKDEN